MNIIEDHGDEVTEDCIDLIILDTPGGREYCSAFLPYISRACICILTTDVNTELYVRSKNRTKSNVPMKREPLYILRDSGGKNIFLVSIK
jgi:translation elongation factor EF-1alpha